jgi:outer membrane biosynthesis protein TonB
MRKIACAAALVLACAPVLVLAEDVKPDFKTAGMKTSEPKKPEEKKERPEAKDKSEEKKEKDKGQEKKKPPPMWSPWDMAFGAALMTDYNFRGITQSNHNLSVAVYAEPRVNFNDSLQGYVGLSGESVAFTSRAAGEIDFYGGIRPSFGRLGLDFGVWEYWYPGGECFHDFIRGCLPSLPNGNITKADLSFWEVYGKAFYAVNDQLLLGGSAYWSPSVFNSGAKGTFAAGMAKYILPTVLPNDIGWFISADVGHWFLGTSDRFYAVPGFPGGIPYKSYTTWDVGLAFMWKQFTFDLRYYDTNLNRGDCNAFTHDFTASGVASTPINPGGPGSNWCGAAFIAKFSFDLTNDYLKGKEASEAKGQGMNLPDMKMPETKWPKEEKGKSEGKKEKPEAKKSGEGKPEEKKEKSEEKKPEKKPPAEFDYGVSLMTEFNIRGISASNHEPAVATHFEPRYNLRDNLQAYGRVDVDSIFLANRAEASINLYAGIRPTFGNLTVDYGWWQRVFPGEVCVTTRANPGVCLIPPHLDYGEFFAKPIYKVDKRLSLGGGVFWSPSVLNSGDPATYVQGLAKYVLPTLYIGSRSIGSFLRADVGHWFREGTPYVSYTNWNIGLTFTSKQYALELRYSDTDKVDCDVERTPTSLAMNPRGPLSDRCRGQFIARFSVDLDGGYSKPE